MLTVSTTFHKIRTTSYSPKKKASSISPRKNHSRKPTKKEEDNYYDQIQALMLQKYMALSSMDYMDDEVEALDEKERKSSIEKRNRKKRKTFVATKCQRLSIFENNEKLVKDMQIKFKRTGLGDIYTTSTIREVTGEDEEHK